MKSLHIPLLSAGLLALSAASLSAAVAVVNGDFEANAAGYVVWPGYSGSTGVNTTPAPSNPGGPTGWTLGGGGAGVNGPSLLSTDSIVPGQAAGVPVSPFTDNGLTTGSALFLQQSAWAEQTIAGFVPGADYILSFDINARTGDIPEGTIYFNGTQIVPWTAITPVGEANPYHHFDIPFPAPAEEITIRFESRVLAGGADSTLLLDNVSVTAVPEPAAGALLLLAASSLLRRRTR